MGQQRSVRFTIIAGTTVAVLLAVLAATRVQIADPRVHVRWRGALSAEGRVYLERKYGLHDGAVVSGETWQYRLRDRSSANVAALVRDLNVADTGYIDRNSLTVAPEISFFWYPFSDLLVEPAQLLQLQQSVWVWLCGGSMLVAAGLRTSTRRRSSAVAVLAFFTVAAVSFPISPRVATMGGSEDRAKTREDFESFYGERVRFEKHLSQFVLLEWYRRDETELAGVHAHVALTRVATVWFVLGALIVGVSERWSPLSIRYLGLALLAPASLLFFGWREFGYLSLSLAPFPLLVRGLRNGDPRLEGAGAVAGLATAFHGAGVVSLSGLALGALVAPGRWTARAWRALRVVMWGCATWLGWLAFYEIVLRMPISPDPGPAAFSSWRPLFTNEVRGWHIANALFSLATARDLLMTAWIIGAPLALIGAWCYLRPRRPALEPTLPSALDPTEARSGYDLRIVAAYALPSMLFVVLRWPYDGVGGGLDLVIAGFPAAYALIWVCAHDPRAVRWAMVLLISAHYGFWRVVLDKTFVPPPIQ